MRFGTIPRGDVVKEMYAHLNDAVTDLARSLPRSLQAEAMFFIMGYAGLRLGEELDFFRNYHAPIWTCLQWISSVNDAAPSPKLIARGVKAHAMAMMLHSLDDHLSDGEVPPTHLALLIRSQAWRIMHDNLATLAANLPGGADTAAELIDTYYGAITATAVPADLDGYCALFEPQMATGLIVPVLLARCVEHSWNSWGQSPLRSAPGEGSEPMKTGGDAERGQSPLRNSLEAGVRASLGRFGVAWRLLDDIQDVEEDMKAGRKTAVYWGLSEDGRRLWDNTMGSEPVKIQQGVRAHEESPMGSEPVKARNRFRAGYAGSMGSEPAKKRTVSLTAIIQEQGIIDILIARICRELDEAARHAAGAGLKGLADEYRILAGPLR